jgi:hypothetical protein
LVCRQLSRVPARDPELADLLVQAALGHDVDDAIACS